MKKTLLSLILAAACSAHAATIISFDQFSSDGAMPPNYGAFVTYNGTNYVDSGGRLFDGYITGSSPTPNINATWTSNMRVDGATALPGNQYGSPGDKLLKVAYKNNADGGNATTGFEGITLRADAGYQLTLESLRVATDDTFSTSTFSLRIQTSPDGSTWTTAYQNFNFGATANTTYTLNATTNLDSLSRSVNIATVSGGQLRIETNKRWNLVMDNITFTQAVPEPSSALLTLTGLCGFLAGRRRRG